MQPYPYYAADKANFLSIIPLCFFGTYDLISLNTILRFPGEKQVTWRLIAGGWELARHLGRWTRVQERD